MSPALKSAFIGLMLLGLVVTQTNADLTVLNADIDAVVTAIVAANLNILDILSKKSPVPKGCCDALVKLKADIALQISLGITPWTCCNTVKAYVPLTILVNIPNVLGLIDLCAIVDLDAYLKIC